MQRVYPLLILACCLSVASAQTYVTPVLGGGQVQADMVHIDIYYDMGANDLQATVDDSFGTPMLRPLEPGLAFDPAKPYAVLNGKAYNSQYGWNVGGFYSLPPGSAIWIELIRSSAVLETYADWGSTGTYTNIFGTGGSSRLWKWTAVMVHNTYAVSNPPVSRIFADYHLFFGDAETGSRANFMDYDDTFVRLEWTVEPVEDPLTMRFGAVAQTNGAALSFLNADQFVTNSQAVVNFPYSGDDLSMMPYEAGVPLMAVPATTLNGGPFTNPAALGARLELQLVSLTGPPEASFAFWENGETTPRFQLATGETAGTNRILLTENYGAPGGDPYGCLPGRRLGVNKPGLYCLGFRVLDTSTNGPAGGPIHAPSPTYSVYLQAGVTIASLTRNGAAATVLFGGASGLTFYLECSLALGPTASWQTVAGPLSGTNRLQSLTDPSAMAGPGFYRLRVGAAGMRAGT